MKKTKFLALALIVAMALVGAGFAWWTDQLTIAGTVETGNLEVVFSGLNYQFSSNWLGKGDNSNFSDKHLDIHIVDMYPGSSSTVTIEVTNTGTVPAVLENIWLNPGLLGRNFHFSVTDALHINGVKPVLPGNLPGYGGELINPGETIEFKIKLSLPYGFIPCNNSQNGEVNFRLNMNWRQYNPSTGK